MKRSVKILRGNSKLAKNFFKQPNLKKVEEAGFIFKRKIFEKKSGKEVSVATINYDEEVICKQITIGGSYFSEVEGRVYVIRDYINPKETPDVIYLGENGGAFDDWSDCGGE